MNYRIKLTRSVYRDSRLISRFDFLTPDAYKRRSEARARLKALIKRMLDEDLSYFFRSPRADYDLVSYAREGRYRTYLRYQIVVDAPHEPDPLSETRRALGASELKGMSDVIDRGRGA